MATLIQRWSFILFTLAIGPVGVVASKGVVWLVAVAGAVGVIAWVKEGCPRGRIGLSPVLALATLMTWAAVGAAWAFRPVDALNLVARLAALSAAGIGLLFTAAALDNRHRLIAHNAALAGIAIAFAMLFTGFFYSEATGKSLWGTFYFDPLTTLNNGAVTISLLTWPVFALLWRRGWQWTAGIVAAMIFGILLFLSSGAALLALVAGGTGFLLVYSLRKRGAVAIAVIIALLVMGSPQVVGLLLPLGKAQTTATELPPSARHRLTMWAFAVEKINEKPIWGWGMDASRSIPQEDRRLAPNMEIMPLHPHNAFLQARLELGLPGAAIIAALLGIIFADVIGGIGDRTSQAFAAGAASAYLAVAAVSYGMWQNWWVAMAWTLAALIAAVLRPTSSGRE